MSIIQTWNFDIKNIAQQIQSEHNVIRNRNQGKCAQPTDTGQFKVIDGTGNELQMKLSTVHRHRFFGLGPKVQYTKVELFNKNGEAIGEFKFNRGKNLEKNIKSVLNESNKRQLATISQTIRKLHKNVVKSNAYSQTYFNQEIGDQQFNITATPRHQFFRSLGTDITVKDRQGHSVTFPFCSGKRLTTKLNAALQSIASQTPQGRCRHMVQVLDKWSCPLKSAGKFEDGGILQKMQAEALQSADSNDWNSPSREKYKMIGELGHPISVLRNTLALLGAGQEIGLEGQRVFTERPDQMIQKTLSALQDARSKGILKTKQLHALLKDLQSAVNTIAEACPDNEALQKFASDFAKLTLKEEKETITTGNLSVLN